MAAMGDEENKQAVMTSEHPGMPIQASTLADEKSPSPSPPKDSETSVRAWLQVLGAFFMFFNIW